MNKSDNEAQKTFRPLLQAKSLLIFGAVLILLSPLAFTLPAFWGKLDFTKTGSIGDTIGGITSPIVNLVGSILVYLALRAQIEANHQQQLKNESDIIFLLLNQLEVELSTFYYSGTRDKTGAFRFQGIEAIERFAAALRLEYELGTYKNSFKTFYESSQIILLIRSFRLVEQRIRVSPINNDLKGMFATKLQTFFVTRLQTAIETITQAAIDNPHLMDDVAGEIIMFGETQKSRIHRIVT